MSVEHQEPEVLHACRNHLAIVVSYADLLLQDLPADDPRRQDVLEIRKAGQAAAALLRQVAALNMPEDQS
jgi:two-component system, cell cycle sensor histidine kinase and response regulator CckA